MSDRLKPAAPGGLLPTPDETAEFEEWFYSEQATADFHAFTAEYRIASAAWFAAKRRPPSAEQPGEAVRYEQHHCSRCGMRMTKVADPYAHPPAVPRAEQPTAAAVDERAEFEKWFIDTYPRGRLYKFPDTKTYRSDIANSQWVAWQARASCTAQPERRGKCEPSGG